MKKIKLQRYPWKLVAYAHITAILVYVDACFIYYYICLRGIQAYFFFGDTIVVGLTIVIRLTLWIVHAKVIDYPSPMTAGGVKVWPSI